MPPKREIISTTLSICERNSTIFGRAITIQRKIEEKGNGILPKNKQRRLRAITLQGTINKSLILLVQYMKTL